MEDINEVIKKIDEHLAKEGTILTSKNFHLKVKISRLIVIFGLLCGWLGLIYLSMTENDPEILRNEQLILITISSCAILISFIVFIKSKNRFIRFKKLTDKRSAIADWLTTKSSEQQQDILAIMRQKGKI